MVQCIEKLIELLEILVKAILNDKIMVIVCTSAIALATLSKTTISPEAQGIIIPIITGLMGVAVGTGIRRNSDNNQPPNGPPK